MRSRSRSLASAVVLLAAACGGSGSTDSSSTQPPPPPSARLTINVTGPIPSGTSTQATAIITAPSGTTSPAPGVHWSSDNPSVGSITADGLITGKLRGTVTILATSGTLSASTQVEVIPGAPALVEVYAGNGQSAPAGARLSDPLCTTVKDAAGNMIFGAPVAYTVVSGDGQIAEPTTPVTGATGVAISGLWTLGPSPGTQTVRARSGDAPSVTFTALAR